MTAWILANKWTLLRDGLPAVLLPIAGAAAAVAVFLAVQPTETVYVDRPVVVVERIEIPVTLPPVDSPILVPPPATAPSTLDAPVAPPTDIIQLDISPPSDAVVVSPQSPPPCPTHGKDGGHGNHYGEKKRC